MEVATILDILATIPDPEIPVISIVDLGIVRDVSIDDKLVRVKITPTYSGCPAMHAIRMDIISTLYQQGFEHVDVEMVHHPAWTTDWIGEDAKEKLRQYGIAPPVSKADEDIGVFAEPTAVPCPRCASTNTRCISTYGATACKAMYSCKDCLEPFEYFKCH